jgi:hypothetical protein
MLSKIRELPQKRAQCVADAQVLIPKNGQKLRSKDRDKFEAPALARIAGGTAVVTVETQKPVPTVMLEPRPSKGITAGQNPRPANVRAGTAGAVIMKVAKIALTILLIAAGAAAQQNFTGTVTINGTGTITYASDTLPMDGPADLPTSFIVNQPDTAGYTVVYVHNTGSPTGNQAALQAALNAATCMPVGEIIRLDSGIVYQGATILPGNAPCPAGQFIIIETDPSTYKGPPPPAIQTSATLANRQGPSTEKGLAVLTSTASNTPALQTSAPCTNGQVNTSGTTVSFVSGGYSAPFDTSGTWNGKQIYFGNNPPVANTIVSVESTTSMTVQNTLGNQTGIQYSTCLGLFANHYWIRNLELSFTGTSGSPPSSYSIVQIGQGSPYQDSQANFIPHYIVFDRDYIHADLTRDVNKALVLNCSACASINNDIRGIEGLNWSDSNAIGETNSPGPLLIDNNLLQAAGENILLGGASPYITNVFPSNITITHNLISKDPTWFSQDPNYDGLNHIVKNLVEFKHGQYVLFEGNLLEYCWAHAQRGGALSIFGTRDGADVNGGMDCPACSVNHYTIRYNVMRHAGLGITIGQTSAIVPWWSNFSVHDNLEDDFGAYWTPAVATICGASESGTTVTLKMCADVGSTLPAGTWPATVLRVPVAGYNTAYQGITVTVPASGTTLTYTAATSGLPAASAGGTIAVPVSQIANPITSSSYGTGPGASNSYLLWNHNTMIAWKSSQGLQIDPNGGPQFHNITVTNNLLDYGHNGVAGHCSGILANTVNSTFLSNGLAEAPGNSGYTTCGWSPSTAEWFPSSWPNVGFTAPPSQSPNWTEGNYTIQNTSPFYQTGTDNRNVGADIGQISSHQNDWKGTN